ncbi:MAG: substrate-binding domain-containing protein [Chloroflexota bacterium]
MSEKHELKETKGKKLTRRDFLRAAGLSTGALVLAACGGQAAVEDAVNDADNIASEAGDSAQEVAAEPGEINWWYEWGNFEPAVNAVAALEGFQEHIGNNTLNHRGAVEREAFLTALAAGDPPDGGSNTDYPGFWARGVLLPVDDLLATSTIVTQDDMLEPLWNSGIYDGQMIGVPGLEGFIWWGLNYNAAHVEEAGLDPENPPLTFDELYEWHTQLTKFDSAGNLERLGIDPYDAMAGEPDFPAFSHGLNWWNDAERTFNINDPRMAEAVNTFAEFYRFAGPDSVAGMRSVEGQGTWGAAFEAGVQSMIIEGYWHPGEATINQPEVAQHNRATWAPVPASREGTKIMATGAHFVILFKDGQNTDGMFKVAEYMQANESLDIILDEVGWLTGRKSYIETVPRDKFPGLDFYLDASDQVDEWLVGRRSPIHWFVAGQWDELKEQVFRDLISPDEAVAELQKRAEDEWEAQDLS